MDRAPALTRPSPHPPPPPQSRLDYLADYFAVSSASNAGRTRINIDSIAMCVILGNRKNNPEQTCNSIQRAVESPPGGLLSFSASRGRNSPRLSVLGRGAQDRQGGRPRNLPDYCPLSTPGQQTRKEAVSCRPRMGLNIHCAQGQPACPLQLYLSP